MEKYNFQFCQKIVVFSKDRQSVLLCKRKDEKDYDGVFSFIGGKMEIGDESILAGLKREKDEEVGPEFKIKINPKYSANIFFIKKNGLRMILPHYYAIHQSGEIELGAEYSEFNWVRIDDLEKFEPKIKNIPDSVREMMLFMQIQQAEDLIKI
ncbi:MAG: NUDIX domain-containing protein [Candidatus Falkowbacteria bacterium]|nr:NUDIX domain-containing protein [Candidatus Falkowbacteria bacterium]